MSHTATMQRALSAARGWLTSAGRAARVQANEAAMIVSATAMAPLRLVTGGFAGHGDSWPGATAAEASTTPPPVMLVHGFAGTKSSWALVAHALCARGMTVEAMGYPPHGTSVEELAARLIDEVEMLLSTTAANKVHLVGHSLGGVVIAHAITDRRLHGRVDTVITLGSPFGGSPWADLLPVNEIVRALRRGSPLLRRLACAPPPDGVRWVSMTAALDVVVPGLRSVPSHERVHAIRFDGIGHLGMLLSPQIIGRIANELSAPSEPADTAAQTHVLASAS
jgi:triacylglycerol lipase